MTGNPNAQIDPPLAGKIESALKAVDRKQFVYSKTPSLIVGHSIPSTDGVRQILLALDPVPVKRILHIGVGCGYLTAVLAMLGADVIGIEKMPSLVAVARQHLEKLKLSNVEIHAGDGKKVAQGLGPFDLIVISTPTLNYKAVQAELSPHGQLICFEKASNALFRLIKYTRMSDQGLYRKAQGLVDFSSSRNDILSEIGLVSPQALQKAKVNARQKKGLIIDELHKLVQVDDAELYQALAQHHHLPLGNIEDLLQCIQPGLFNTCSRAFLDYNHFIPICVEDNILKLVTHDPDVCAKDIEQIFPNYDIEKILVTPTDFHRLWSVLDLCKKGSDFSKPLTLENPSDDLLKKDQTKPEPHLVSIFEALLLDAVAERASDIHIEQYSGRTRIRLRIDGELMDINYYSLSAKEVRGLVNVIKLRADLNIAERRLPQGGRSRLSVGGKIFDLRIQIQPALHGEHVIIRLLPQNTQTVKIENLGFSQQVANHYRRLLDNPAGLVLVVGPTGSGKSTTLYAGLQVLANDGRRKVITIEDPIEYSIDNIQQVRIRPEINFNFADAMRAFVREDPDVILIGEIRDRETALEAIRASQTGHVVLSTLHSNDAVDALQRMYDLDIQANSLACELLAIMAQRLAKKICPHCKAEVTPEPAILAELFPDGAPDNFRCFRGKGCAQCHHLGTHGRVAVVEYLQVNQDIRNAISRQPPIGELRRLALDNGLVTMRDSALDHVIAGNIPLSELPKILPAERMAPEQRGQLESIL